jgi:outer membrane protein TolC
MIMMLLVGCAVGPDYQQPAPPPTTHWNDKGDSGVKSKTDAGETNPRWWKTFNSPQLDSLIERAIAGNLTLQQTVLRIAGAREQINQAGGAFYPSVNGNLQGSVPAYGTTSLTKADVLSDSTTSDCFEPNLLSIRKLQSITIRVCEENVITHRSSDIFRLFA